VNEFKSTALPEIKKEAARELVFLYETCLKNAETKRFIFVKRRNIA
jgi:hypothetical protein